MIKRLLYLLFIIPTTAFSQTQQIYSTWNVISLDYHFNNKFYLRDETHLRTANFLDSWEQILIRPSLHYKFNDDMEAGLGYTYTRNFASVLNSNENDIFEQFTLTHKFAKSKFIHRFRYEQRFIDQIVLNPSGGYTIANDKVFKTRFWYRFGWNMPIIKVSKTKHIDIAAFDEIYLNTGEGIEPKSIDQNWFYVGLTYPFFKNVNLDLGYLSVFSPKSTNTAYKYRNNNILQTTISYRIK